MLEEDAVNMFANVLASSADLSYSNAKAEPKLAVTLREIDGSSYVLDTRTFDAKEAHTFVFDTTASSIEATAEVQSDVLASFGACHEIVCQVDNTAGTITVTIPESLSAGVYRIKISMDAANESDDVYFGFVLK